MFSLVCIALLSTFYVHAVADESVRRTGNDPKVLPSCQEIALAISPASAVFMPGVPHSPFRVLLAGVELGAIGSSNYSYDIEHYLFSSTEDSVCSIEPGSVEDLSKTIQIIAKNRVPFAVKGGGHATNPEFSSTCGIHIAMSRFREINYNSTGQTVELGAGLLWDDVYVALEPYGVIPPGARAPGVGVAGFTLGGGKWVSWLANEHGLAMDSVLEYDLVLPNGTFVSVTQDSSPDLFFGLKGGYNNFVMKFLTQIALDSAADFVSTWQGIVTKFTFKGGFLFISTDYLDQVNAATMKFMSGVDPKASIITNYEYSNGTQSVIIQLFYNGPNPAPGVFDDFLAIPAQLNNLTTQTFPSLIGSSGAQGVVRGRGNTVSSLGYSETFLKASINESTFWGNKLKNQTGFRSLYSIEPFLPSPDSQSPPGSTAFPSPPSLWSPTSITYLWEDASADPLVLSAITKTAKHLTLVSKAEGQDIDSLLLYSNYAIAGTSITRFYGSNVGRLRKIKYKYDPENVMGLAGGWKF